MAHTTSRLRFGALVAAGALTLGGLAVASPAAAEPIEPVAPVIELDKTTFPAGDWEDGFRLTGSGFDPAIPTAQFTIGVAGAQGAGEHYSQSVDVSDEGTINVVIVPDEPTVAPDAEGYPEYAAWVNQVGADDTWVNSNTVEFTIVPGVTLELSGAVTPEAIAAGVTAQFGAFGANEVVWYDVAVLRFSNGEQELIADTFGEVTADANGAGAISVALADAQVGDQLVFFVEGAETGRMAERWFEVVAAPAPVPTPVDPAPAPAAPAGDVNRLPDTGVDLGIGITALALLAMGAGALVVTRRVRATQG